MIEIDQPLENHPRFTNHIIGHSNVIGYLKKTHHEGKLPHGLLFVGPKGIGKATLAHKIARALLTQSMENLGDPIIELTPIDHLLRAGNCPDFISIEKSIDDKGKTAKDISIEKARSVVQFFSQTSLEDKWRIALIDSVDDLTTKGANTLLKILEEPPHKCLLILISHNLEGVLPTLRSRSQIIQIPALSTEETAQVFKDKKIKVIDFLSTISAGRPGLGLMISDLGGSIFYDNFLKVMADLSVNDLRSTHTFVDTFILKNKNLTPDLAWQSFFNFLNHWVSHALIQVQKDETNWGTQGEADIAKTLFATRRPDKWVASWFHIQDLLRTTHVYSLDKKQTLLCVFHELAGLHQR